jgi:hypothetical protein
MSFEYLNKTSTVAISHQNLHYRIGQICMDLDCLFIKIWCEIQCNIFGFNQILITRDLNLTVETFFYIIFYLFKKIYFLSVVEINGKIFLTN